MQISGPGPIPADALQFFRAKISTSGFDWRDIWRTEHAHAFTVAKAVQADVLESIRSALDSALAEGMTMRQFAKELTPTLQKLGWWGRAAMEDPVTGEIVDAQLGSPRRLKTIYRANMRSARAAGQWLRAQRTKAALPYLLYELGPSKEHRKEHVKWHGTLLSIDHSWWNTHMPPNGWGCKCRVRQISRAEARRLEQEGKVTTTAPATSMVAWKNKRTGQTEMVPAGIDPGWDTNPGKARQQNLEKVLSGKLDGMGPAVIRVARADLKYYKDHQTGA